MTSYHSVYGLRIRSNLPIPGLRLLQAFDQIDVEVNLGVPLPELIVASSVPARYVSPHRGKSGEPLLVVKQESKQAPFYWIYNDGTKFFLDSQGLKICATWPDNATLEDTVTYLLGPVLGFVLRLRGIVCLHASAISIDDRAVVLLGPAGAGKSTTAAAFAGMGYPVLSEDVVPLIDRRDMFLVQSGYPGLRLWPDSVKILYGSPESLPRITPNWDKRYLDLIENGYQFQHQPLPLVSIYILGERSTETRAPFIKTMSSYSGLMTLVTNTYTNYLLTKEMRAREFELLGRVVDNVPLRSVVPNADPAFMPDLCQAILEDFFSLTCSEPIGK